MSPIDNPGVGATVELGELNVGNNVLIHSNNVGVANGIADVAVGQVLTSQGATSTPAWATPAAAGMVNVNKSIPIAHPTASEDIPWFYTENAITVSALRFLIDGATNVTVTIRHDPDRSAAGNEIVTGGTVVTNTGTGQNVTSFDDETIPAGSYIWVETTAKTGDPTFLHVSLFSTED